MALRWIGGASPERLGGPPPAASLAATIQALSSSANEATTRISCIDRVLDAMGWRVEQIEREQPAGAGGFIDYELSVRGEPWMIIEAKRAGASFDIAGIVARSRSSPKLPMQTLLKRGGQSLREVLQQAANYSNDRALPLACATNGHQWVFFRGLSSAAGSWTKGTALCFLSAEEINRWYEEFALCFSQSSSEHSSVLHLLEHRSTEVPPRFVRPEDSLRLARRYPSDKSLSVVRAVGDFLFGDIYGDQRDEMLERCYVQPGNLGDFERSLQRLLRDDERAYSADADEVASGGSDDFVQHIETQHKLSNIRSPVLVIGHVGAGKSTFLHRSLHQLRSGHSAFVALVDFEGRGHGGVADPTVEEQAVASIAVEKLGRAAQTALKHRSDIGSRDAANAAPFERVALQTMFREEISREYAIAEELWRADPLAWKRKEYELLSQFREDRVSFLERFIRHLNGRFRRSDGSRYPILLVLDNLDQATSSYQKLVYGLAHRIARNTRAVVVVCIREDTYREGRLPNGFLTSSPLEFVFHVASPPIDQMLHRRVRYGRQALRRAALPAGLRDEPAAVEATIHLVNSTLLTPKSGALDLVAGLGGHNVRHSLELTRAMVVGDVLTATSPSATAGYALECIAAAKGHDDLSRIGLSNVYDADPFAPPLHALKLRLLAYLSWSLDNDRNRILNEDRHTVVARFASLGYPVEAVEKSIDSLLLDGLIRGHGKGAAGSATSLPERLSLTASGHIHLTRLPAIPAFRAMMAISTRWYDAELAREFTVRAAEASGDIGVTLGDINEARAVDIFDAYLQVSITREDERIASAARATDWGREVFTRSKVFSSPAPTASTPWPARKTLKRASAGQTSLGFMTSADEARDFGLAKLPRDLSYGGTVWLPRILWALEFARLSVMGPLTAADIARVLVANADIDVPSPNVARAFRDLRNSEHPGLWISSGKRFEITVAGSTLIQALLAERP